MRLAGILTFLALLTVSAFAECPVKESAFVPVKFTYSAKLIDFTGHKLFFAVSLQKVVFNLSLDVTEDSQFPLGFEKNYKQGEYLIFVCDDRPTEVAWVQKVALSKTKLETKRKIDARNSIKRREK